jgi:hypothetical protein
MCAAIMPELSSNFLLEAELHGVGPQGQKQ